MRLRTFACVAQAAAKWYKMMQPLFWDLCPRIRHPNDDDDTVTAGNIKLSVLDKSN